MAISLASIFTALGFILLSILSWVAWRTLNWVWLRPRRLDRILRRQGLKGNQYRSLSGDLPASRKALAEAISKPIGIFDDTVPRILPFFHGVINTYGKDSFSWDGPIPRLNVLRPDHIKEVLNRSSDFQKPTGITNPLAKKLATGIFSAEGEKWAKHRKIINPAFTMEKIKLMVPAFNSCSDEMVANWNTMLSEKESVEVDVFAGIQNMTRDVISRTAFGSSHKEGSRIFQLQTQMGVLVLRSNQSVYIPGWRFIPTDMNKKMKSYNKEIETLLKGIIHKKERAIREGLVATDDLLGIMLESNMKEITEHNPKNTKNNVGLSIQDIIEECKLFYIAGQETTSTLVTWTMFLLSIHPSWQDRARDEVLQVFGRDSRPDFERLNHLKIVTMILYEVLRLYPPLPALTRQANLDTKLGKLTIPAGTRLLLPVLLVHHDKELWGDDAKEFNPERFSEGIAKATKNQVSFFPFGWGQRICIGQNFALLEAKLAIAMILQRFTFELSPTYTHAPMPFLTLQPQHGLQVILRRA